MPEKHRAPSDFINARAEVHAYFFDNETKLTDYRKSSILRTVIIINFDNNKNYYYFCKLVTVLLQFRRFNLYLNEL